MVESETTDEIAGLTGLGRNLGQRWVDWAIERLVAGEDTPTLRVLAGESAPFSFFEMKQTVERALDELGVEWPSSPVAAANLYAAARIRRFQRGALAKGAMLAELAELQVELDHAGDLHDFYLLHHAWDQVKDGEYQLYVPDVNAGNFDTALAVRCTDWLGEHG